MAYDIANNYAYAQRQFWQGDAARGSFATINNVVNGFLDSIQVQDGVGLLAKIAITGTLVLLAPGFVFQSIGVIAGVPKAAMFATNTVLGETLMEQKVKPFVTRLWRGKSHDRPAV